MFLVVRAQGSVQTWKLQLVKVLGICFTIVNPAWLLYCQLLTSTDKVSASLGSACFCVALLQLPCVTVVFSVLDANNTGHKGVSSAQALASSSQQVHEVCNSSSDTTFLAIVTFSVGMVTLWALWLLGRIHISAASSLVAPRSHSENRARSRDPNGWQSHTDTREHNMRKRVVSTLAMIFLVQ